MIYEAKDQKHVPEDARKVVDRRPRDARHLERKHVEAELVLKERARLLPRVLKFQW